MIDLALVAPAQRSGSTLLQRIFNSCPRTQVWGEHGAVLEGLLEVRQHLLLFATHEHGAARDLLLSEDRAQAWTANASPAAGTAEAAVLDATRALLDRLYGDAESRGYDRVGFKAVRYGARELDLLVRAYPDIEIAMIVRDPFQTLESIAGQGWPLDGLPALWSARVLAYLRLLRRNDRARLFRLSDLEARAPATVEALSAMARISADDLLGRLDTKVSGPPGHVSVRGTLDSALVAEAEAAMEPAWELLSLVGGDGRLSSPPGPA